jgi:hypothetical protein
MQQEMKYSFLKYLLYDLKHVARYPPASKYENDKQIKKTKEEYSSELEQLKEAHPVVSTDDIDNGKHTHTLMSGGKFLLNDEPIPEHVVFPRAFGDLHKTWREACPRLLQRQETYDDMLWLMIRHTVVNRKAWSHDACLTEVVSKPFHKFFLDLDILFAKEHDSVQAWNALIRKICLSIGKAVLSCFPGVAASQDPDGSFEFSVLCTKGYRQKQISEQRTVVKRGIHMVWPGLIVDKQRAESLARAVDEFLTRDVPRDLPGGENTWKEAIDLSVYKSGLRPVGCSKITPCPKCRPLARKKVPHGYSHDDSFLKCEYVMCHPPTGFVNQGEESEYSLDFICRGDGAVFTKADFRLRLDKCVLKYEATGKEFDFSLKNWTSIRSSATGMTEGFDPPSHLRAPVNELFTDYNVDVKQDLETGDFLPPAKRPRKSSPKNSHALVLGTAQLQAMTTIFANFHAAKYKNVIIDSVWAFPTDDPKKMLPPRDGKEAPKRALYSMLWFRIKGEGSNYCFNKPGFHGSSTIRFEVHYDGSVYQSCWSSKVYNGKPCCKQSTKGKPGPFNDRIVPADYGLLVDVFTTKN